MISKARQNINKTTTLTIPAIFQDNMILQRQKPVPVWGQAISGVEVTVSIQGQTAKAAAGADGAWKVILAPLTASEAETMTITSCIPGTAKASAFSGKDTTHSNSEEEIVSDDTITEIIYLKNIAVGEVWIAAGQSNMEFWMRYEKHLPEALAACPDYRIRFFRCPQGLL